MTTKSNTSTPTTTNTYEAVVLLALVTILAEQNGWKKRETVLHGEWTEAYRLNSFSYSKGPFMISGTVSPEGNVSVHMDDTDLMPHNTAVMRYSYNAPISRLVEAFETRNTDWL